MFERIFSWSLDTCNWGCRQLWHTMWYSAWRQCWLSLQSADMEWQWSHIVTFHESGALPFVFVIRQRCYWITTHCVPKPECRMGIWVWWHIKYEQWMEKVAIVENLRREDNASLCCSWNPTSSNATTSSFNRLGFIFTGHVSDTIGQSNTYFFILPLTQRLMLLGQNQNSYSPL